MNKQIVLNREIFPSQPTTLNTYQYNAVDTGLAPTFDFSLPAANFNFNLNNKAITPIQKISVNTRVANNTKISTGTALITQNTTIKQAFTKFNTFPTVTTTLNAINKKIPTAPATNHPLNKTQSILSTTTESSYNPIIK